MFDMARFVEVKRLLEAVEAVEDRLTAGELEMYRSLRTKCAEPVHGDFDDVTCLEVILHNVEIRKDYRIDPKKDASRVIELTRTRDSPKR